MSCVRGAAQLWKGCAFPDNFRVWRGEPFFRLCAACYPVGPQRPQALESVNVTDNSDMAARPEFVPGPK